MKCVLLLGILATLLPQDAAVELKAGDVAPKFESVDAAGKPWKSEDHVGKKVVVVYFYPASFTGGCTGQAMAFQADMKKFAEKDVEIVGVSGDSVKTQALFKKTYKLDFALLADGEASVAKLFGVPTKPGATTKAKIEEKVEEITRTATISRWTFIIGRDGKIAYKNTKVNPTQDSAAVLEILAKMN
jgi:peroxiredoxin Q/BCP